MKVLSISLLHRINRESVFLGHAVYLSHFGFFKRKTIREMLTFIPRILVDTNKIGSCGSMEYHQYVCYYLWYRGICGILICDCDYPERVVFKILYKAITDFLVSTGSEWTGQIIDNFRGFPKLYKILVKSQDPCKVDKLFKIQSDLYSTQKTINQTIDIILERGEKIDDLIQRSDDISRESKLFYKGAKNTNSCCNIC